MGKEFPLKVNTSIRKYLKMFGLNYDSNQTLPVLRKTLQLFLQRNNSITHPPRKLKVKGVVSIIPIDVHWSVEYLHSVLYQLFLLNFFVWSLSPGTYWNIVNSFDSKQKCVLLLFLTFLTDETIFCVKLTPTSAWKRVFIPARYLIAFFHISLYKCCGQLRQIILIL